jgi:hypothetical protein
MVVAITNNPATHKNMKSDSRSSAFLAITLSTSAITACVLTFPMLFHFVQRMEANAQAELEWYVDSRADMDAYWAFNAYIGVWDTVHF